MADIRVSPEALSGQGNELVGYSGDISDILTKTEAKINEIADGWEGLAKEGYYELYSSMKDSLTKLPELVEALGKAAISAAEAFSSVDEQLKGGFGG